MFAQTKKPQAASNNHPQRLPGWRLAALGAALLGCSTVWAGPTVTYTAVGPVNVTVGSELWSYQYTVTGPIDPFGGVTLRYAFGDYSNLALVSGSPEVDLSTPVTQPDVLFGDGLVTVTWPGAALASSASSLFSVEFTWSGAGSPGAQGYAVFDANFGTVLESQTTVTGATVPEPSVAWLSLVALAGLAATRLARLPQAR